jgi:CheY-like chemotaxis protein
MRASMAKGSITPQCATLSASPRARFQPRGELKGLHALVVDDDKDNLELTAYLLESAGCQVSTAFSAANALAALEHGKFGLVVSDIGLPDQDGLELMREIRARGYDASELPAIALTGYAGVQDANLVSAAGYQKHLAKPLDARSLLRAATELGRKSATE